MKFDQEDKECSFQPKVNKISYLMDVTKNPENKNRNLMLYEQAQVKQQKLESLKEKKY